MGCGVGKVGQPEVARNYPTVYIRTILFVKILNKKLLRNS